MSQENAVLLYKWILGIFGVGAGAIFLKSKRLKTAEEDNIQADFAVKMMAVVKEVQSPMRDDISRLQLEIKESNEKYMHLAIKVAGLEKELEIKDKRIVHLEAENTHLKAENKQLIIQLNGHYKPLNGTKLD